MKERKKILLVEDDPMVIRLYKRKLSLDGYGLVTAFNGAEGLEALEKEMPDIVLLDIMMPKLNGLDTLKRIKADKRFKQLPVVILTNLGDRPEDVEKCKKLGADDYWVKVNINIQDLGQMIERVISLHKRK